MFIAKGQIKQLRPEWGRRKWMVISVSLSAKILLLNVGVTYQPEIKQRIAALLSTAKRARRSVNTRS